MRITVYCSPAAALAVGSDAHGYVTLDVPADSLTERQRAALAPYLREVPGQANARLSGGHGRPLHGETTVLEPATPDALRALADHIADTADAQIAAEMERRTAEMADVDAVTAAGPEALLEEAPIAVTIPYVSDDPDTSECTRVREVRGVTVRHIPHPLSQRVASLIETARIIAAARNAPAVAVAQAEMLAARQARIAEREAAATRKQAQVDAWVAEHGTESQRARHTEHLLPLEEVTDGMREQAFAPLSHLPRYQRLTSSDVRTGCTDDDGDDYDANNPRRGKVEYAAADATEATAEEYAALVSVRQTLAATLESGCPTHCGPCKSGCTYRDPYDAYDAKLRTHTGKWDCGNRDHPWHETSRTSVHVTLTVREFTFTREFAV